jgi:bacteriocin biosynthesis cyclodehydratase domain-containing protein
VTPPPLPRILRLPAHLSLLRRGPSARQFGLDPRTALAVDDLSPPLASMLDELTAPVDRAGLIGRAVRRGADPEVAEGLLRGLVDAGVLVDAGAHERATRRRAEAAVAVIGDGRLAVGIATGLALAGVGTLQVGGGGGPVRARDVGTGLLDGDRGRPRGDALLDAVRRVAPGACAGPRPIRPAPGLYVLADAAAPDPVLVAELHATRTAHLPVRLRDGVGVVGPLVLPGRSPCLGCLELHRTARDPGWPVVAAQLMDRDGEGEQATALATAALGVAQALAVLDGGGAPGPVRGDGARPPTLGATLELDLAAGTLRRRRWGAHPECTCAAPPGETCGPVRGQGTIME